MDNQGSPSFDYIKQFGRLVCVRCFSLLWFTLGLCLLPLSSQAVTALNSDVIADDNNLLIVNLKKDNLSFQEDLFIFHYEGISLIPLQPLFDQLEFAIEVDPEQELATGWYISENNKFTLKNGNAFVNNQEIAADKTCFFYNDDLDYYASMNCINAWFGLGLELQVPRLGLHITSNQVLPFMARMERKKKQSKIQLNSEGGQDKNVLPDQYALLSKPVADVSLGYSINQDDSSSRLSTQTAFDFVGLETRLNYSHADNENQGSLIFNRALNHQQSDMLLGLGSFSMGDVYGNSNDLIYNGGQGTGIKLTSKAAEKSRSFTKRIIEGSSVPGWEVELYRNGALIEFTEVQADGRYVFEDVDIEYGNNIFDIKLYGPQGQLRTRRETVTIGQDRLKPKQMTWDLDIFKKNQFLIDNRESTSNLQQSTITQFNIDRGMTEKFGLGLHLSEKNDSDSQSGAAGESYQYQSLSIYTSVPGMNVSYEQAFTQQTINASSPQDGQDKVSGTASGFNIQGNILDYSSTLQLKHFDNFISDRLTSGTGTNLKLFGAGHFSLAEYYINHSIRYDLIKQPTLDSHDINNQLGIQTDYGLLSAKNKFLFQDQSENIFSGEINFNSYSGQKIRYKLANGYDISPKASLTYLSAQLAYKHKPNIKFNLDTNLDLNKSDNSSINLSGNYGHKYFSTNPQISYKFNGNYSISVNLEFSYSPYKRQIILAQKQQSFGQVEVITFLDKDDDGKFNNTDEPLADVKFKGLREWESLATDDDGEVVLTGLSSSQPNRIQVIEASIGDPFWRPKQKELSVLSHAGGFQTIYFPVLETLEVEGSVKLSRKGKVREGSGIPLELHDQKGNIIAKTKSEFDGVFVFTGVPKGQFNLHIPFDYIKQRNISEWRPLPVNTKFEEGVYYMDEFTVYRD